jgi:predicted acylesterase/phospholipase RssA
MKTTHRTNTNTNNDTIDPSIAVTLSGGGHRASIFGLGVLIYLCEIHKNKSVTSIASVSGGSITNGYIGKECNFRNVPPNEFQKITSYLWNRLTHSGIVYAALITKIYIFVILLLLFSIIISFVYLFGGLFATAQLGMDVDCNISSSMKYFIITTIILLFICLAWLLSIRGKICQKAFAKILFSTQNKQALFINSLSNDNINHIICATELHADQHIYFSSNFVYSYPCGLGASESTTLAAVVQASAAFPPLLPPIKVKSFPFHFSGKPSDIPHELILTDGGVYNNMGEQWIVGLEERKKVLPDIKKIAFDADIIILVNSTAGIKNTPISWFDKIPLVGEGTLFYRIICSLFDQTTTTRREKLFIDFRNALITGEGKRGIMVMIEQTPFQMLDWMQNTTEPELEQQRERTISVLDKLPKDYRKEWDTIKKISMKTGTTFRVINQLTAENLIYHAFIVAMINAHIVLGFPMIYELLDKDEFRKNILNKYCQ